MGIPVGIIRALVNDIVEFHEVDDPRPAVGKAFVIAGCQNTHVIAILRKLLAQHAHTQFHHGNSRGFERLNKPAGHSQRQAIVGPELTAIAG